MSKFLPSLYTIRGLRAAQGLIFRDMHSPNMWLERFYRGAAIPEHIKVLPAEIIYYPSNLTVDFT